MQPKFELAQLLRVQWKTIEQSVENKSLNTWQLRTLSALSKCRTSALGGHIDGCNSCGALRISYNSCRNRHCPKCQGNEREAWIQAREKELLPVAYFHVVFTLPSELNTLCMQNPKLMYDSLFDAAWNTINAFAKDEKHLGATTGMISILHTWGQQLTLHPHLHCIIPAGGLSKEGKWKHSKTNGNYLFPVKALSVVFRAKYVHHLRKNILMYNAKNNTQVALPKHIIDSCFKKQWVVYAKRPFSGVNSVVEYLGRYTHKVAISNHRITTINNTTNTITFNYKDYKDSAKKKLLTLDAMEFVRRFSLHVLPKAFVRIRHYGILSSTCKTKSIAEIRKQLPAVKQTEKKHQTTPYDPLQCPCCKKETMVQLLNFNQRGPPINWKLLSANLLQQLITH
jgi:Putative transposase/Transposase zinc-binding domain